MMMSWNYPSCAGACIMNMKERLEHIGIRIERIIDAVPLALAGICASVLVGTSLIMLMDLAFADTFGWRYASDHQRITILALATLFGFMGFGILLLFADGALMDHSKRKKR
jgi:hypothetical protein